MRDVLAYPHIDELRFRLVSHCRRSRDDTEVRNLWCGYLIALAEWGLIDDETYGVLRDELYQMTSESEPRLGSDKVLLC